MYVSCFPESETLSSNLTNKLRQNIVKVGCVIMNNYLSVCESDFWYRVILHVHSEADLDDIYGAVRKESGLKFDNRK